jgi:hypothetical protein
MSNEPKITWRTIGRKLNEPDNPSPSINVIEYPQSVTMNEGDEPYGIPIDAPLAVSMIKALHEKVSTLPPESDFRKMMEGSFAITFDKNVLLKTISQPKCEGIRFYLCVKKGPGDKDVLSLVTVGVTQMAATCCMNMKKTCQLKIYQHVLWCLNMVTHHTGLKNQLHQILIRLCYLSLARDNADMN